MDASILSTKLNPPPARANLVNRACLLDRLQSGLPGRLTLVSAPPGFGKTTLVVEWLGSLDRASAWLSLDAGDNDPARFFAYLVAAFQKIEPSLGRAAGSLLAAPQQPPVEVLVTALLNDLARLAGGSVLVLDDYHTISNTSIHEALCLFVERQPDNLHLVLVTREDPPLRLPRLRARGEMNEVRQADLRFSLEESRAFLLDTMGLELSLQSVASLAERTEGWVAGLQMAALALRSPLADPEWGGADRFVAEFHGDDRFVMDYLMEEVFQRQPSSIQDFLLQTSILDRLCAPLCAAVIARDERDSPAHRSEGAPGQDYAASPASLKAAQEVLESLEQANLFLVPLDGRREWYRYHHLFADLLRNRLGHQDPQLPAVLHRRACLWHRQAGNVEEAMAHALAIPDAELAADLAEEHVHRLINLGRLATCLAWLPLLPTDAVYSRAYLCSGLSWACLLGSRLELAGKYLEAGEAALDRYQPVSLPIEGRWVSQEEVRGQLTAIRAYRARLEGDFPEAVARSQQALAELPSEAQSIRCVVALNLGLLYLGSWQLEEARQACLEAYEIAQQSGENLFVAVTALSELGAAAVLQGFLDEGVSFFHRSIQLGKIGPDRDMPIPAIGYAHGWLGAVYFQRDQLDEAENHLQKALELVELIGPQESVNYAYLWQARLALARGDLSRAESWLSRVEARAREYPLEGLIKTEWLVNRVKLALARGDLDGAESLLESHGVPAGDLQDDPASAAGEPQARLPEYLLRARSLLARGKTHNAIELLEKLVAIAESSRNAEVLLEVLALRALAEGEGRATARGLSYLVKALNLAAPQGYLRPILEAGEPLEPLLHAAVAEGIQPGLAGQLLTGLSRSDRGRGTGEERPVEPLTGRELQVLRLLAAGLTSTQIAAQLFLSIHTTRSYIKTLYRKLDAHTRAEAIEKGYHFDLLENPPRKPPR
jgi:LuxR family transcriptional regulator, maltose regulon positive regulatory protein